MIKKCTIPSPDQHYVLLYDRKADEWLEFRNPLELFQTHEPSEIIPALQEIESVVQNNRLYAAGFVSYEAAPAFDSALCVGKSQKKDFPLLFFGAFAEPEVVSLDTESLTTQNISQIQWTSSIPRRNMSAV